MGLARRKAATYMGKHEHRTHDIRVYPFVGWDSNSRSQCPSERRQFMPQTVRPLWPASVRASEDSSCLRPCGHCDRLASERAKTVHALDSAATVIDSSCFFAFQILLLLLYLFLVLYFPLSSSLSSFFPFVIIVYFPCFMEDATEALRGYASNFLRRVRKM
jgi:hypothetical protein